MSDIPKDVRVICASKYFDAGTMRTLYDKGQRDFGENRVQDMIVKMDTLSDLDITWHFIGHLQTNKVKAIINAISVLHSLDSLHLAKEIQKRAHKTIECFIQVNMTGEGTKSGIGPEELDDLIHEIRTYDKIRLVGLMTIGKADDPDATEKAFKGLAHLARSHGLDRLSIGMSEDYAIALEAGATDIRLGRMFLKTL